MITTTALFGALIALNDLVDKYCKWHLFKSYCAESEQPAPPRIPAAPQRKSGDAKRDINNSECKAGRPSAVIVSACMSLIEKFPEEHAPYSVLSSALRIKNELDEALKYADKALKLNPGDPISLLRRGMIYRDLGQASFAVKDFQVVQSFSPQSATDFAARGLARELMNDPRQALADYDTAIVKDNTLAMAFAFKAQALIEIGKPNEAITEINKAIDLEKTSADYYEVRGRAQVAMDRATDAVNDFTTSIQYDNDSWTAYRNRGQTLLKEGRYKEAVSDLSRAASIDAKNADTYALLGLAYLGARSKNEASEACQRSLALNSSHKTAASCLKRAKAE